ncbi:unnamed protein product [Toxocara canis]|uniref:Ig-like domain-containing protein n=1 Tax=Toxocara canis TaxID=6265 RepID=A0A183TWY2_TOXCA|nr:unnamed protein product [Toxocara canis]
MSLGMKDSKKIARIFDANANGGDEAVYHMGLGESQVPVFATDSRAFDVRSALRNALTCPVKYISRLPPTMVSENYCFVVDGDAVSMDAINAGSEQWWKGTGTTIRYYYSEELKKFYQVNALLSRGEVRCAYKVKGRGGGMEQVPLDRIFKYAQYCCLCTSL